MVDITSISNSRVKLARRLRRKRYRDQTGLCVLEGVRLVQDAWRAGAQFDAIFVVESLRSGSRKWAPADPAIALLDAMQAADLPVFTVTDEVLAAITETVAPQGIVALTHIPHLDLPVSPHLVLVLDRVRDPGNAGTLLRSAAAAGADLVIFAPETVDPYNDKVLRAAMGAHFRLPLRVCGTWRQVTELMGERACYVADAGGDLRYDQVDWGQPAALIVGSEATGPGDEARRLARPIAIPMGRATESLNAAVAGSIILFEAARQRRFVGLAH